MATGLALTIGLNFVDHNHYVDALGNPWNGQLFGCEFDAKDMAKIAESNSFRVTTILTKEATRTNILDNIKQASTSLSDGDIFMLSYSGHGGQITDYNLDEIEIDQNDIKDETLCLYDGQLIDDEIYSALSNFKQGIRIIVFSDSCHSGTVVKAFKPMNLPKIYKNIKLSQYNKINPIKSNIDTKRKIRYRYAPTDVLTSTFRNNFEFYQSILKNTKKSESSKNSIKSSVILISSCQDHQLSQDNDSNGLFTSRLLHVWDNGLFQGNYVSFHKNIMNLMPRTLQEPNFLKIGLSYINFENQRPFTI